MRQTQKAVEKEGGGGVESRGGWGGVGGVERPNMKMYNVLLMLRMRNKNLCLED